MTRNVKLLLALIVSELSFSVFWFLFPSSIDPILPGTWSLMRGEIMSYPAVGYPALFVPAVWLGVSTTWWAFYIQLFLCLAGVWIFFDEFDIPVHWGSVFGLLPFIAVMALKQTAAVPCFLVFVAVVMVRARRVWVAALLIASSGLFRTELLILLPCLALAGHVRIALTAFAGTCSVLFLLTGNVMSTNTPGVFYSSLGQLKGNPWGLTFGDSCSQRVALEHGIANPWSVDGAVLFTDLSIKAIAEHPVAYAKKVFKNLLRAVATGPYIGEWRALSWGYPIKIALHLIFGLVMFWCLTFLGRLGGSEAGLFVIWMVVLILLAQGIGNQMVRHSNIFYLPLLALVIETRRKLEGIQTANYEFGL